MLIDEGTIFVRGGRGGDGCLSFRREKYIPKGGPDGGDGGRGGNVILRADPSLDTLLGILRRPHYRAKGGGHGQGKQCCGADANDLIINVPLGTVVILKETEEHIVDLDKADSEYVIARGGYGGFGNEHFKSAINQAPRETTQGELGEEKTLLLKLKILADVGLVGLPNAGKSSLLTKISRARPKIADYPFTTLQPHLGLVTLTEDRRFLVADIPGLIEGAAEGSGLGHEFLKHIERTKILIHVVDIGSVDLTKAFESIDKILNELNKYSEKLIEKKMVLAFNKSDLILGNKIESIKKKCLEYTKKLDKRVTSSIFISAATGEGISDLIQLCWKNLKIEPDFWIAKKSDF